MPNQWSDGERNWYTVLFIRCGSPLTRWPLLLSWPLSGSHIRSVLSSYPAQRRPPPPRDCRLPLPLPRLRRVCIRCRAVISSLNTSPRPDRASKIMMNIRNSLNSVGAYTAHRSTSSWRRISASSLNKTLLIPVLPPKLHPKKEESANSRSEPKKHEHLGEKAVWRSLAGGILGPSTFRARKGGLKEIIESTAGMWSIHRNGYWIIEG